MKTGCSAACKRESEQPPCRAGILLRWSRRRDAVSWPGSPWSPWLLLSGSRLHRVEPGRVFLSAFCLRSASRAQAESRGVFPSLREPRRSRRPGRVEGTGFETIATLGDRRRGFQKELPPMLARRTYASASELDGKIYVMGGQPSKFPTLSDLKA